MKLLVILFDELSASSLGCYGSRERTPHTDTFASESDIFTSCFADRSCDILEQFASMQEKISISEVSEIAQIDEQALLQNNESTTIIHLPDCGDSGTVERVASSVLDQFKVANVKRPALVISAFRGQSRSASDDILLDSIGEQATHVPLIVSLPGQGVSRRRSRLLTTSDFAELVIQLTSSTEDYEGWRDAPDRTQIEYRSQNAIASRTRDWLLIQSSEENDAADSLPLLFRKPEDTWETLDVANQYPQVVEHFQATGILSFPSEI